jgi:hypothetical protein
LRSATIEQDLALALERADQRRPVAVALVDRLDRRGGLDGPGAIRQHALVGRDRGRVVAELVLVDVRCLNSSATFRSSSCASLATPSYSVDEIRPAAEARASRSSWRARSTRARIVAQRAGVGVERLGGVVAADLVELGDLVQELDLARGIEGVLRHDLVDADLLLPRAACL